MALMQKIQTLDGDGQREILALYSEPSQDFVFPIEVRNLFAEQIENAVCGGDVQTVDQGLDPKDPQHSEKILQFLGNLTQVLEDRLGNTQSGDQFFVRHKLQEALQNFQAKKQTDPLGLFGYIRDKLKSEIELVAKQEAALNKMTFMEKDVIMDNIQVMKTQVIVTATILKDIRSNEENFALNCNEKQRLEGILKNPEQLQLVRQQHPNGEEKLRKSIETVEGNIHQNIINLQEWIERFQLTIQNNLSHIAVLEGQIIYEKLATWKHEQQKMANKIVDRDGRPLKEHTIHLERLQLWCEELADLIWKSYEQLKEAERILRSGLLQTGNPDHLTFVQNRTEDVLTLLQRLLNQCLIIEEQPPQIIKMKTKFPKSVVVSLLIGKRLLNIQMKQGSVVKTDIISEEHVQNLHLKEREKDENIGEITNGSQPMEYKDKKFQVTFKNMQLKSIKRTDRRGSSNAGAERVMEEKACLYFVCEAIVGDLLFRLSTISLPVVVISHGSQEALAVATIAWDNAFGEIGRAPFKVPQSAPWKEVANILNSKFYEVAGRGLTEENLVCLAQKAFRHKQPQPEIITWSELCKENLPSRNFTFWTWFHAALKLIEKKETHLKDLWKEGLIVGFIDRDYAESLISRTEPGTFLLRFADSIPGAITIALLVKPGTVVSLNPYQMLDLQSKHLARSIKEIEEVKYLYKPTGCVFKDDAFGKFYERESTPLPTGPNTRPYVPIVQTVPDGDRSNGSATPQPYDNNRRLSGGSSVGIMAHSPISIEPSHSPNPFFNTPQSPQGNFHEMKGVTFTSTNTIGMDNHFFETPECSQSPLVFIPTDASQRRINMFSPASTSSNNAELKPLETPLPTSGQNQVFQFSGNDAEMTFHDLIRVIGNDGTEENMEIQL